MSIERAVRIVAAALPLGWACGACAQSSVTLYGIVNPDVVFVSNAQTGRVAGALHGDRQISLQDATTSAYVGSRFGIRGREDLGAGTFAVFTLENGFSVANGSLGQGGALFGRQAFVGVSNERFGSVMLGRQYSPVIDFLAPLTTVSQWGGFITAHPDDIDDLGLTVRQNNAVKFSTPVWHGWSAGAMYALGGVPGHVGRNQVMSAGVGYAGSSLRIGVGYLSASAPNVSMWGGQPNGGGSAANNIGSFGSATAPERNPVMAGYASASREQTVGAGASYALGNATIGAVYTNTRFVGLGSDAGPNPRGYAGSASFNTVELNGSYRIGAAVSLGASYSYTLARGPDAIGAHYHQVNAGVHYALSKRTDVYMIAVYQRAAGTDSLGQPAVASINGMTPSASRQQFVDAVGIAHRF
ncbi:porin [Burkholderia pseudomultivorans]|uniref:Outer membrane porin protein n=2 Tax=Burkholderia pseudomultivorans TaxID=1207504 RepID=A0ABU2E018_9BURK|nr:porin [Burkholderia pseudomultivorans]MDR8726852.1 Outer membrane porin protein [Burkholderia pseudomultivorans]MDR8736043.1 Outer membrane porin protein [Burkholderia pseudomultivorans]MDR8742019.1 Outer membrane porin protein [Burkholderia pseudomultivorans]MDR8753182.1 Outer membrane porin protein [Burkholderia pseudomultivorans]MDR8778613.1 Outer membrane porin protein [Burkholderia pseudomultivorans]